MDLKRSLHFSDHGNLSLRHNSRVYHSIILCTDAMYRVSWMYQASLPRSVAIETQLNRSMSRRLHTSTEWTMILHCPILNNPMFLLSCLVPAQHQSLGWRPCSPSHLLCFRGELREESELSWLDWVGCKSVQSLGWCPSLRRADDLAGQYLCPPVFWFGALRVVTRWELERDARGLTFDVL